MSPIFRTQNNGVKNATVKQWRTVKHLSPVQVWANIITRLKSYPGTSDNTPVNTLRVDNHKTNITSQMKIKSDVRHNLLRRGTSRILTQRSGHPFTLVRIFHGDLPIPVITRNDQDHRDMVQKHFILVHPDSSYQPQKRHQ